MMLPIIRAAFERHSVFLCYGSIFLLSLFFCYLLSLAYPYGIIAGDTGTYLWLWQSFHLWQAQQMDWIRTPPFAIIIGLATYFPQPSIAIYWFHALLFSTGIVCVAWMMSALFRSVLWGALFAFAVLVTEVLSMHAFFYNLFLLSDPMYAQLILIGSALILGGWMRKMILPVWVGYIALGLAAFTRPVGLCLFPVWIMFAIGLWIQSRRDRSLTWSPLWTLILCIFFLTGPVAGWTARNGIVYGYFRETAFGGRNLLPHVFPLIQDDDPILDNPQQNKEFMDHLRAFGEEIGTDEDVYRWGQSATMPNIFDTLSSFLPASFDPRAVRGTADTVRSKFVLDSLSTSVAFRIILLHPFAYADLVSHHYRALLLTSFFPWRDTVKWYQSSLSKLRPSENALLFPPAGTIDPDRISPFMTSVVQAIVNAFPFRTARGTLTLYGVHFLFVSCLFLLWKRPAFFLRALPFSSTQACVVILMLLCTTLGNHFFVAMLEGANERYAVAGETGLHISLLLGIILLMYVVYSFIHSRGVPRN